MLSNKLMKTAGVAASLTTAGCLTLWGEQRRFQQVQAQLPGVALKREFHFVPIVGGYWRITVDEDAAKERSNSPKPR